MTNAADQVLQKLKERAREGLSREEIAAIVTEALKTVKGDLSPTDVKLYSELESLNEYIQTAKQELANIKASDISSEHIPSATDELDAVVGATEDATNKIMNACDQIMEVAGGLEGDANQKLMDIVTGIYEACNFQDITGQRITKVVRTLKHIEEQVLHMVKAFGIEQSSATQKPNAAGNDSDLLNGPQLPGNAINQDEIDKLLASFDEPQSSN